MHTYHLDKCAFIPQPSLPNYSILNIVRVPHLVLAAVTTSGDTAPALLSQAPRTYVMMAAIFLSLSDPPNGAITLL